MRTQNNPADALLQLRKLESEIAKRANYKLNRYFPDTGPLRRDLYHKSTQFFKLGADWNERLLLGGNRTGKTQSAAYECSIHLTGLYPEWWEGKRFTTPIEMWAAGDTATTTRDIAQLELFGPLREKPKSGFIPAHLIQHYSPKNAIPNGIETIWVKHVSGGMSTVTFKSFDQRREAFQGTARHLIWLDEECPEDVYTECLLRTLTIEEGGILINTFTPVEGLTPFVQDYLEHAVMFAPDGKKHAADAYIFQGDENIPEEATQPDKLEGADGEIKVVPIENRYRVVVVVGWDEVPHLDAKAQQQMIASIPEYQRVARTKGIPHLGSGVIYPVDEMRFKVNPFPIPKHWRRGFGMDVGWNWTVAIHGTYDPDSATVYLYREHYLGHEKPAVHAEGIKAPGPWIPGRIDPAANGRSQDDGQKLLDQYIALGLKLDVATNAVEAGIFEVWSLLTAGRLKVFSNLQHWFAEYRMYRRDAKGRVIKKKDHAMDCTRYLVVDGFQWFQYGPNRAEVAESEGQDWAMRFDNRGSTGNGTGGTWMG